MKLYRGEIASRYDKRIIGFSWSSEIEAGRMFASRLGSLHPDGGVLIESLVPTEAIISDLREHSHMVEEREIVVDPWGLNEVSEIRRFPFTGEYGS